jgi:hypothetical protein
MLGGVEPNTRCENMPAPKIRHIPAVPTLTMSSTSAGRLSQHARTLAEASACRRAMSQPSNSCSLLADGMSLGLEERLPESKLGTQMRGTLVRHLAGRPSCAAPAMRCPRGASSRPTSPPGPCGLAFAVC